MQLSRIDEIKAKRKQVAAWYQELLDPDERLMVPKEAEGCDLSWFVFVVRLQDNYSKENRDNILKMMRESGIQASNYFPPVHLQPFIAKELGFGEGDFPITEGVCKSTIALPFYNNLPQNEVQIVCNKLKEILEKI